MFLLKSCVLLGMVAYCLAETIDFHACPDSSNQCTINEVRVDPCPQASTHSACHIKRRRSHTMNFEFTPNFDAETLEAALTWVKSEDQELPLITMDKEACKYTTCPVRSGVKQTYTIDIPTDSKFPVNYYTIKWVLSAPSGEKCCFTHDIKLVR